MKYLVLGSSGQIGRELTNFLKEIGQEVYEFDIINNSDEDLRIRHVLDNILREVDFVFFLAYDVGGSVYLKKYQYSYDFVQNNTLLQSFTFESIKKYGVPFIFASSQMSNMTFSPYGACKKLGEVFTKILSGMTVKFWNVYGLEKEAEKFHVITDFINSAQKKSRIEMLTDGQEQRQFLHARDCCECLFELSRIYDDIDKNKDYHITSFEWIKIIDLAQIIAAEFKSIEVVPGSSKDTVQNNSMNNPDKHILNYWNPKISLNDGIKSIINDMQVK